MQNFTVQQFLDAVLHTCKSIELSDRDPYVEVEFAPKSKTGAIALNYPWIYLDFTVRGRISMTQLDLIKLKFLGFSALYKSRLDTISLSGSGQGIRLRVSLIVPKGLWP